MQVDQSIFKAYDIRGIYPDQINEKTVYAIGRAYATLIKKEPGGPQDSGGQSGNGEQADNSAHGSSGGQDSSSRQNGSGEQQITVAVGRDMRLSSPSLSENLIAGLLDSGINVDDIGLVSTPTFYFGAAFFGYLGGIQVSASHNPKEFNGLKIVRKNAVPVSGETGIMDLYRIVSEESFAPLAEEKGTLNQPVRVVDACVGDLLKLVNPTTIKPFKIVIDAANAMGILDIEALFSKLACNLIKMNFDLDGTFPAHPADPMVLENTADLRQQVVLEQANLGIALDGDADRYFFVDETGEMVPQQILRGLMAQIELREHPGAKVAYDIRPGRVTQDMIEELGGHAIVTKVGHSLIKETMIKEGAIFGGESSGHYMYRMPYGTFEVPLLLTLKLLRFLSEKNKPLSEIIKPYKRYLHSGEINTQVGSREEVEQKIAIIKEKYKDGKQIWIDGLTVEYPDVWFNVRGSNTEPLIRLAVEGKTIEAVERKRGELLQIIQPS